MKLCAGWIFIVLLSVNAFAQDDPTATLLRYHIGYLASDELEGRKAGSKGAELAAHYIAGQFASSGLKPLGGNGTYLQNFVFTAGVKVGTKNTLSMVHKGERITYAVDSDFRPLPFSSVGDARGPVVFAGYGISSFDIKYDDYSNVNVNGKIVVVMQYSPGGDNPHSEYAKFLPLRYKTLTAREKGAKAAIFITGVLDDSLDELIKLRFDNSFRSVIRRTPSILSSGHITTTSVFGGKARWLPKRWRCTTAPTTTHRELPQLSNLPAPSRHKRAR